MVDTINQAGTFLAALLMRPFRVASPWPGLVAASLALALLALLAFKYCSNQRVLRRRRDRAIARLLELHLYRDDLPGIFATFGRVLGGLAFYLLETLKPLAVLAVPVTLLLVQWDAWFAHRDLRPTEAMVVTVRLDPAPAAATRAVRLEASPGLAIETEPFVASGNGEVLWRIRSRGADPSGWVEVTVNGTTLRKSVASGLDRLAAISEVRVRGGWWERLTHPLEPALPPGQVVRSIAVDYPARALPLGRRSVSWLVALLVLSVGFGWLLKYPLRVEL
jgi:hypothetical protein